MLHKQAKLLLLRFTIFKELLSFLWNNKLWWAIPVVVIMLLLIILLIFGQNTGIGPLIYPLI